MGKYKIQIKRSAVKEIQRLPAKDLKKILKIIEGLSENPRPFGCRKLSGAEKYRIRSGRYRILYLIKDAVLIVYIVRVALRKDAYR
jgi:mRNA interferase RelE/StbE